MPLQTTTTTLLIVTPVERDRVNAEVATQATRIAEQATRITALEAEVAALKLPPLPVPGAPARLYVDRGALYTKKGVQVHLRGIELMWGPTASGNPAATIAAIKSFGANAIGPLFQPSASTAAHVTACIQAARAAGMIVGVNADHTGDGFNWIRRSDIVSACNIADNVFLQCEVEQGDGSTAEQWRDETIAFVKALRDAGHRAPIKVGSPLGGRLPQYALRYGAAVLASDPLRSIIFTWQAYWKASTTGWQYANEAGFDAGTAGALQCADAIGASGLCFVVGLDGADDVGPTPYAELAARLHQHGIGWQWWAWMVGDSYGNGLVSETLSSTPKAPFGTAVRTLLQAQGVLPSL